MDLAFKSIILSLECKRFTLNLSLIDIQGSNQNSQIKAQGMSSDGGHFKVEGTYQASDKFQLKSTLTQFPTSLIDRFLDLGGALNATLGRTVNSASTFGFEGDKGSINLIQNEEEAQKYNLKKAKKIAFVTQTTLSIDDTKDIIKVLKDRFPNIKEPYKEDICYATTNRQMAVKNIAKKCDAFFIIGSRNSSNSLRLVEVAKKSGCSNAQLIHSQSEIPYDLIKNLNTIGISSGASAPETLVKNFVNSLKSRFTVTIDEVEIIKEDVVFKIPKKLN